MPDAVAELNERFAIEGELRFTSHGDGSTVANLSTRQGEAALSLSGAHLLHWSPLGHRPVLWLSPHARLAPGHSIRGGIPICWPWFGQHERDSSLPSHGFARVSPWTVERTAASPDGGLHMTMALNPDERGRSLWPHAVAAKLAVDLGRELRMDLITRNHGSSPIIVGEALHTYFSVSDVRQAAVTGLSGCLYLDKVDGGRRRIQEGKVLVAGEVDRVYVNTTSECCIEDPGFARRIRIRKSGSRSTVVWNPWIDKATRLGDFGEDGHLGMICVESGNTSENVITVAPGGEHILSVRYSVEALD